MDSADLLQQIRELDEAMDHLRAVTGQALLSSDDLTAEGCLEALDYIRRAQCVADLTDRLMPALSSPPFLALPDEARMVVFRAVEVLGGLVLIHRYLATRYNGRASSRPMREALLTVWSNEMVRDLKKSAQSLATPTDWN